MRRISKIRSNLMSATVGETLAKFNHWRVLNVLCYSFPRLAFVEVEMNLMRPRSNAVLKKYSKGYHSCCKQYLQTSQLATEN